MVIRVFWQPAVRSKSLLYAVRRDVLGARYAMRTSYVTHYVGLMWTSSDFVNKKWFINTFAKLFFSALKPLASDVLNTTTPNYERKITDPRASPYPTARIRRTKTITLEAFGKANSVRVGIAINVFFLPRQVGLPRKNQKSARKSPKLYEMLLCTYVYEMSVQ